MNIWKFLHLYVIITTKYIPFQLILNKKCKKSIIKTKKIIIIKNHIEIHFYYVSVLK